MTSYAVPIIRLQTETPGKPIYYTDPIEDGANGGVRAIFDLDVDGSYPGPGALTPAVAPLDGQTIYNIAHHIAENLTFESPANQVAYAGGGFDFSGVTAKRHEIVFPASALADIISGQQYFSLIMYVKLPIIADWFTDSGNAPLCCTTSHVNGYAAENDLLTIVMRNGGGLAYFRQTTALNASQNAILTMTTASDTAGFTQIHYWRNVVNTGFVVRNANETKSSILATTPKNSLSLTGKQLRMGVTSSLWDFVKPSSQAANNFKIYRAVLENLEVSGRDPQAVANADYARVLARNKFN